MSSSKKDCQSCPNFSGYGNAPEGYACDCDYIDRHANSESEIVEQHFRDMADEDRSGDCPHIRQCEWCRYHAEHCQHRDVRASNASGGDGDYDFCRPHKESKLGFSGSLEDLIGL